MACIVSDLTFVRNIKIGSRSSRMHGQISPSAVLDTVSDCDEISSRGLLQRSEVSGVKFEGKYGALRGGAGDFLGPILSCYLRIAAIYNQTRFHMQTNTWVP